MTRTDPAKQLAKEIADLRREVRSGSRASQGRRRSVEGGATEFYDADGTLRAVVGVQPDGSVTSRDVNAPPPPRPSDPAVTGGPLTLRVVYDGLTASGEPWPLDTRRIDVHMDPDPEFVPSGATRAATMSTAAEGVSISATEGSWTVRLVAVNSSLAQSEPSGPVTVEVLSLTVFIGDIGGVESFVGPTEPTATQVGSFWLREPDNLLHRWDGTAWVPHRDGQIQTALEAAAAALDAAGNALDVANSAGSAADVALQAANGKSAVTYSLADPQAGVVGTRAGDVWFTRTAAGLITAQWEWDGDSWEPRLFTDALFTTITAGKIATGTLAAGVSITAGNPAGNRLVLSATGIQGIERVGGVDTVNFGFDVATGNGSMRGTFQTVSVASRSVYVSSNIGTAGGTVAQPGVLFRNPTTVNRWAQMYSTNNDLTFDGPAFTDTAGVAHVGSSWKVNIDGLYGYTAGDPQGDPTFALGNNGVWQLGARVDAGTQAYVSGDATSWRIGNGTAGTFAYGTSAGSFMLGDINPAKVRLWGTTTELHLESGLAATHMSLYGNGTWAVGHNSGQAIYTVGEKLIIRDRQVASGGGVELYTAPGSWFDVRPSDNGTTQGGMFVHGRFGASIKNFIIDHPTDPTRHLVHSSTESPVAGVEYWGTATLDKLGEAVVTLPAYFEALTHTSGRAVLLTPVGRPEPVGASEVVDGTFTVYGPKNGRVAWLVKAARKDSGAAFDVEPLRTGDQGHDRPTSGPPETTEAELAPTAEDPPKKNRPKSHSPGGRHGQAVTGRVAE